MPLHGLDILVVEEHYFVATELTSVLRELGADVVGPVARLPLDEKFADRQVDVALLDVELGDGPSYGLIDEMAGRGVPVALITGHGSNVLPAAYRDIPRLDKPFERDKLKSAVLLLAGRTEGVAA